MMPRRRAVLLEYLTQSENELLRPLAASRLGEIGGRAVVRELLQRLESDIEDDVRILMIQILAEIGDGDASLTLIRMLESDALSEVRQRVAMAPW